MTDAGLKELAGLTSLQTLNLSATRVTDAGLKELADDELAIADPFQQPADRRGLKELARMKNENA